MRSETASAIDFALYCERAASGRRQVLELVKVNGYDHDTQTYDAEVIYCADEAHAA